jgi:hypothetical protein
MMRGALGTRKKQRMTTRCVPNTGPTDSSPLSPRSLTTSHPDSSLDLRSVSHQLRTVSCTLDESVYLVEPVRQDAEAHRALNRLEILLPVSVAVPAPAVVPAPALLLPVAVSVPVAPGLLLSAAVPVHVDDVYLAHVRLLRVAHARETPEQIKVILQSSYEYP